MFVKTDEVLQNFQLLRVFKKIQRKVALAMPNTHVRMSVNKAVTITIDLEKVKSNMHVFVNAQFNYCLIQSGCLVTKNC